MIAAGAVAGLGWLALVVLWLWPVGGGAMAGVAAVLPLGLIALATLAALALWDLRAEAEALRQDRDRLRAMLDAVRDGPEPAGHPAPPGDASASSHAPTPGAARSAALTRRAVPPQPAAAGPARQSAQGTLPLGADAPTVLSLPDLIRALHFPETPDDRAGLRAMQRALQDHKARQVVQAAQDMLTLLSQDGIYMDDLTPDRASPALWRRFAAGDRRAEVMAVGAIRDARGLDICRTRLRDNAVWRDTAHHFLRRFDQMLGGLVPELDDAGIEALSETRSARGFMLVGRAAEVFGPDR